VTTSEVELKGLKICLANNRSGAAPNIGISPHLVEDTDSSSILSPI
jgi:hypothetical protein